MATTATKKLAVLVSGSGTNLQSIIDAIEAKELDATIAVVISNTHDAFALTRAERHGIANQILSASAFSNRREYDAALVALLQQHEVDLVVLAGYMRILSDVMISAYPNAIINIHPALLPSFPGLHAQQQALDYGVRFSGCTIHFVDGGTDTGPIIQQAVVPVLQDDTVGTLSARIQKEEHRLYPQVLKLWLTGKLSISGRNVLIQP